MTFAACCWASGLTSSLSFSSCLGANSAAISFCESACAMMRSRAASSDLSCFIKNAAVAVGVYPDTGNRAFSLVATGRLICAWGRDFVSHLKTGLIVDK